jgi:hypothetical protein
MECAGMYAGNDAKREPSGILDYPGNAFTRHDLQAHFKYKKLARK